MESSPENQLPEVDSLPDGFVESSTEPMRPQTSSVSETETPDYKDTLLALDPSQEPRNETITSSTVNPSDSPDLRQIEGEEIRLSEKLSEGELEHLEQREGELMQDSILQASRTLLGNEVTVDSSHGGESTEEECQSSDPASGRCLELKSASLKETSVSESAPCLQNRKLEDSTGGKPKLVKRSVKSDKELLEFTLKYQKVVAERDAAIAVREKLESLCRELQRQNRILMEECKRVSTEGQSMRQDLSTKFHDAIKDVTVKLEEQKEEYLSQLKENEMLRNKLKHLGDQYAISEQQFQQKLKQKMLELQLADLKLQQHQEKSSQEQSQMKLYAEQVSQLLETEKNLRLKLAADGEKFQQFQDALLKSNEVFETFKQEMEKMAKSIKEFKKENILLKSKCEKSDVTLIQLVDEKEFLKKQLDKEKKQKEKLESLCRSLQAERKQNLAGSSGSDPVHIQVKTGPSGEL